LLSEGAAASFLVYRIYNSTWTWKVFGLWVIFFGGLMLGMAVRQPTKWERSRATWVVFMLAAIPICTAMPAFLLMRQRRA